jgi:hypothetical protein
MTTGEQPMDHVRRKAESTGKAEPSDLEKNVTERSTWIRLIFMIVYSFLFAIALTVALAVVVIQFFCVLITGGRNDQLKVLGHSLAIYAFEIGDFMTFNNDKMPFPFEGAWPRELPVAVPEASEDEEEVY